MAGWLAGFPDRRRARCWSFVTLDHGAGVRQCQAALGAYFGLVPWLTFTVSYAWCARAGTGCGAPPIGFAIWTAVALLAVDAARRRAGWKSLPFAAILWRAHSFIPAAQPSDEEREHVWWGLPARMLAGAGLTVVITQFAGGIGHALVGHFHHLSGDGLDHLHFQPCRSMAAMRCRRRSRA